MRACGILLPVSSLPSPYGIGCFSQEAYDFADRLKEAGQTYWQILPLGPTGYGDSPYQSFSAFAGNPYFIDLDALAARGLLKPEEYQSEDFGTDPCSVDYAQLYRKRYPLLRLAFSRADLDADDDFHAFCRREADWLDDYSLYMAIKDHYQSVSWSEWPEALRLRQREALARCRSDYQEDIRYYCFLQYEFSRQWAQLKAYVNRQGIQIIGDIPIYVAFDSADSWSHPELFQFDADRRPVQVAGCPPDAFAADGQLWGNPLYSWDYHEQTGYAWWIRRMEHCFRLYDVVRVDHFRGFDEYYSIPYGDRTAANGSWKKGPGMSLFRALKEHLGPVSIIAEDLGYVTDSVRQLVQGTGYPGMKLIEFAFDSREAGDYMPYTYEHNSIVYTGTHDNQPLAAWYLELTEEERRKACDYLNLPAKGLSSDEIVWAFIRLTLQTVADTAIIPMQDYLCLGREARMNQPSTLGTNWKWRLRADALSDELIQKMAHLAALYGRSCARK